MDNLKYSHDIKKDNTAGKLYVYDDRISIVSGEKIRKYILLLLNQYF